MEDPLETGEENGMNRGGIHPSLKVHLCLTQRGKCICVCASPHIFSAG